MMTIRIRELRFETIIGLLPHERTQEQEVVVELSLGYEYRKGEYLDYARITRQIKSHLREEKYELLEEALLGLERTLREAYPSIRTFTCRITKPHILPDAEVSLSYHSDRFSDFS